MSGPVVGGEPTAPQPPRTRAEIIADMEKLFVEFDQTETTSEERAEGWLLADFLVVLAWARIDEGDEEVHEGTSWFMRRKYSHDRHARGLAGQVLDDLRVDDA